MPDNSQSSFPPSTSRDPPTPDPWDFSLLEDVQAPFDLSSDDVLATPGPVRIAKEATLPSTLNGMSTSGVRPRAEPTEEMNETLTFEGHQDNEPASDIPSISSLPICQTPIASAPTPKVSLTLSGPKPKRRSIANKQYHPPRPIYLPQATLLRNSSLQSLLKAKSTIKEDPTVQHRETIRTAVHGSGGEEQENESLSDKADGDKEVEPREGRGGGKKPSRGEQVVQDGHPGVSAIEFRQTISDGTEKLEQTASEIRNGQEEATGTTSENLTRGKINVDKKVEEVNSSGPDLQEKSSKVAALDCERELVTPRRTARSPSPRPGQTPNSPTTPIAPMEARSSLQNTLIHSTPPPSIPITISHDPSTSSNPTQSEVDTDSHPDPTPIFTSPPHLQSQIEMHEAFRQIPMTPLEKLLKQMKSGADLTFSDLESGNSYGGWLETPGPMDRLATRGDREEGLFGLKPVAELRLGRNGSEKKDSVSHGDISETGTRVAKEASAIGKSHATPSVKIVIQEPTPVQAPRQVEVDRQSDEREVSRPVDRVLHVSTGAVEMQPQHASDPVAHTSRQPLSAIYSAIAPVAGSQMRARAQRAPVASSSVDRAIALPHNGMHISQPLTRPKTPPFARSKKAAPLAIATGIHSSASSSSTKTVEPKRSTKPEKVPHIMLPLRNARAGPSRSENDGNRPSKPPVASQAVSSLVKTPSLPPPPPLATRIPTVRVSPIPRKPSAVVKIPDFAAVHAAAEAQRGKRLAQARARSAPIPIKVLTVPQVGRTPGRTSRVRMQERGEWDKANVEYQRKREEALQAYLEEKEQAEIAAEEELRRKIAFKANPVPGWLPKRVQRSAE